MTTGASHASKSASLTRVFAIQPACLYLFFLSPMVGRFSWSDAVSPAAYYSLFSTAFQVSRNAPLLVAAHHRSRRPRQRHDAPSSRAARRRELADHECAIADYRSHAHYFIITSCMTSPRMPRRLISRECRHALILVELRHAARQRRASLRSAGDDIFRAY